MSLIRRAVDGACSLYGHVVGGVHGHDIILCYHSVRDSQRPTRGWLGPNRSVSAERFEKQIRWLVENVDVVSLGELLESRARTRSIRAAITFDDGYFDNLDVALPILRRYKVPTTWFVATRFVDDPGAVPWWDLIDFALSQCRGTLDLSEPEVAGSYDLASSEGRRWLNTDLRRVFKSVDPARRDALVSDLEKSISREVSLPQNAYARADEIAAAVCEGGIELGGHTVSHPNVALCDHEKLKSEICDGKKRLEEISGKSLRWFAYPFGGKGAYDSAAAAAVRDAGFDGACTLVPGTVGRSASTYLLPRIAVSAPMTMRAFAARVRGAPVYAAAEWLRGLIGKSRKYGKL